LLDKEAFRNEAARERVRTDLAESPLAILVIELPVDRSSLRDFRYLSRILQRRLRITDTAGFLLDRRVGVLLRDTYDIGWRLESCQRYLRRPRELFSSFPEGFRSIKPYSWKATVVPLLEIPVTTFPLLPLPIYMNYLVYLWQVSPWLARTYLRLALATCRLLNVAPSMLLYPLDFLGVEDDVEMRFFPGMAVPR
jgi:hypothetical protein